MKKLICAAVIAGSMLVVAEEAAKKVDAPAAPVAAEAANLAPQRSQMSAEQRAQMREKFMQRRAAMKAEMDKKMIEVIKKYGLDDEKANALWKEMQETMRTGRRNAVRRPPMPKIVSPVSQPGKK